MQSRPRLTTCVGVAVFAAVLAGASRGAGTPPINPNFQIRSIGIDGTGARNLSQGPHDDYEPAASPDGRKIAFSRATTPGDWDLWVMNSDGTGQRAIASFGKQSELDATWSPDGRLIAFGSVTQSSCPPRFCGSQTLWVVRPDGTGLRRISDDARYPRWSPDGRKLVFEGRIDPYGEANAIYVARAAGGPARRLIRARGIFAHPVWSPDGRRIAFIWGAGLYVTRADGTRRTRLVLRAREPEWAPGNAIAFQKYGSAHRPLIAIVSSRGGRWRSIAFGDKVAWNRRGRQLLFTYLSSRLAVIGPDGQGFRIVGDRPWELGLMRLGPWNWSRDGRTLFYSARDNSNPPP